MTKPPRLADYLLRFFCAPHRLEEVQGDLHEEFDYQVKRVGERRAQWRYWWDVIGFIKPFAIRRKREELTTTHFIPIAMLRNYFSIAFRQLWKNQLFSGLNIVGLTVGLAVSTFIALYVWHEFHYDRFEPFANRTYRIMSVAKYGDQEVTFPGMHESFGSTVKKQIPEVEEVVRFSDGFNAILQSDKNHQFSEEHIGFADAPTLSVLGLPVLQGNAKTALSEPGRIVLTRQLSEKYFGTQNSVGKTLIYEKHFPLTVSAVLDDLPTNSVIQFNGLISLSSMPTLGAQQQGMYKGGGFLSTYLVLRPEARVPMVEKKLAKVKAGIGFVDMSAKYFLEALPTLHLDSRNTPKDTRQSLYILLTIALIILVLAIINYVSLTTARATKRAREVGIRKAIGGQRSELIAQFVIESFLTTTLAFGLSLIMLQALFPWANQALALHMDNRVLTQGPYWGLMIALWLGCSLLSSGYPALLLSGFRPATVLKGSTNWRHSGAGVRQVFTTIQFTASVGLLICSLVLYTQMRFLRTTNLGINRAQVVALHIDSEMVPQFAGLRDAVRQWAGSRNVAVSNTKLFSPQIMTYFLKTEKTKKQLMVNSLIVDKSFFDMMGVRWKYRPVGWEMGSITKDLTVYNQTVMREAGIQGNPIQQPAPFKNMSTDGVVADFHINLHETGSPMMLTVVSDTNRSVLANGGYLLVRLNPHTDVTQALDHLKELYNQSQPTTPFDCYFLDDAYNNLYAKEERLMRLFNGFTALTLLVACLGLLGLMTFSVEARTKEIGVRKVLGASVTSIVTLLSKDFVKLILIAIVIASPIAWWAMSKWLEDFAYKVDISWWIFALAGGLTTGIALLTVSFQSIKAALTNPVKSLRSE
ncbi:permease prefix domain 2-containing transporter [Spirosoma litoris]